MNSEKQKMLIEILLSSADTFTKCQPIIKSSYFDPEYRQSVEFIKRYFGDHNITPSIKIMNAEFDHVFELQDVRKDEADFCAVELEQFCKHGAARSAMQDGIVLLKDGKYDEILQKMQEAVLVSLDSDLGLRYFETVAERLKRMLAEDPTVSTGWCELDNALYGGISRKELLLVSACSGGGKSLTLANLAYNFITKNKLNVLYISLELSEDIVAQRFDTLFTGITRQYWKKQVDDIERHVTAAGKDSGNLDIIKLPAGTSANNIRAYLKNYSLKYNIIPDLLIVDYIDEMSPNEQVSADNVFEKDKRVSVQLREIGVDHNMFIATASQLNRGAVNAIGNDHSHIAGGISKIHVADVYFSVKMTDIQTNQNNVIFSLQKTRNSDGVHKNIVLNWDAKRLRMYDNSVLQTTALEFHKKESSKEDDNISGDRLGGLLSSINP